MSDDIKNSKLYKKLIVQPCPDTSSGRGYSTPYFRMVETILKEMRDEFPTPKKWGTPPYKGDEDDWIEAMLKWFNGWFGKKNEYT